MKKDFSFDLQVKVWMHYVVNICYLNAILKIEKKSDLPEHKIRSFENFVNEKDDRVSEGLIGHYWRFENEILSL